MLAKISEPIQHSDLSNLLTRVEYAINNSVHTTTKKTPCELLFGVNQRGREVDALSEYLEDKQFSVINHDLDLLRKTASENIEKQQKKSLQQSHGVRTVYIKYCQTIDTSSGTLRIVRLRSCRMMA